MLDRWQAFDNSQHFWSRTLQTLPPICFGIARHVSQAGQVLAWHGAFLKQAQALHPKNMDSLNTNVVSYNELFFPAELAQLLSAANGEWALYRSMCCDVPWKGDSFDLFRWWMPRRDALPILTQAALAALATPMHSMDVQRIFSRLGGIFTPQRMGLHEDNKWSNLSFAVHGDVLHKLL